MTLTQPPRHVAKNPGRRRTLGAAAILASFLLLGALIPWALTSDAVDLPWETTLAAAESSPNADPQLTGRLLTAEELALVETSDLFQPMFIDAAATGLETPTSDPNMDEYVRGMLKDGSNLLRWQLCAAELNAEAKVLSARGIAANMYSTVDDQGTASQIKQDQVMEGAYRKAAPVALQGNIACKAPDDVMTARWLKFTLEFDEDERVLAVPDTFLMRGLDGSVEWLSHNENPEKKCVKQLEAELDKIYRDKRTTSGIQLDDQAYVRTAIKLVAQLELLKVNDEHTC